jgi:hypothetical protein
MEKRLGLSVWICFGFCLILGLVALPSAGKPFPQSEVNPLLSTSLQILTRQASGIHPQGDAGRIDPGSEITVILEPSSGNAAQISDAAIRLAGGDVEARSDSLVRVRVPVDKLESLAAEVSGIVFIREPLKPVPLAVVSQGVVLTSASDFHAAGFEGQGANVAIIDLGFEGLTAAQAAGELQNVHVDDTHDYTGNGLETESEHGTGVAEIVEDMAPQARLYLLKIGDSLDLENAVQFCITNGIHVINHSVGWYNSNYYDGTGIIGDIASNARSNDILWVNSAGNEADDGHWQGDFVDTDSDGYHEFDAGADYLDADALDEGSRLNLSSGDTLVVYMTWNDWAASDQDYDLYLYSSSGTQVASSAGFQGGAQYPTEAIRYTATSDGNFEIVIEAFNAPQAPEIEIYAFEESGASLGLEHHDPASTIIAPANSADVLTVGAIRRTNWTTGPQEPFSSQGPSNASIHSASRIKPDIAGPDGTLSTTYGSFYGTSASSPHVAGAAALLLSEDPTRSADDLQTLLESSAIDMGLAGKDNIYGAGRLDLELTPSGPPAGDEVGIWRFDEGSGTTATDSSGNGNHGSILGAPSYVAGISNTALSLDGNNDYISIPDSSTLDVADAITLDLWINANRTDEYYRLIERDGGTTGDRYWVLRLDKGGTLSFFLWDSGGSNHVVRTSATISVGTWQHITATYDGSRQRIYINDILRAEGSVDVFTIQTGNQPVHLGGVLANFFFSGLMDEVTISGTGSTPSPTLTISDSSLPAGQAAQAYNHTMSATGGTTPYVWSATGLPATLSIDPASGTITGTPDAGDVDNHSVSITVDDADTNSDTANLTLTIAAEPAPPAGDEVGIWRFDEGNGTTATDSSGNGNHGSILGDPSYVAGISNSALSLDGNNDYISIPDSSTLDVADAITLDLWINANRTDEYYRLIERDGGTTGDRYWVLRLDKGGSLSFFLWDSGGSNHVVRTSATISVGTWQHVTATYDGSRQRIYINDILRAEGSVDVFTIQTGNQPVHLGGVLANFFFSGLMDEVTISGTGSTPNPTLTISDSSLPAGQAAQAYNHTMSATGGTTPYVWSATGLPSTLSIDPASGTITGTPDAGDVDNHSVSITVDDADTNSDTANLTLTIAAESAPPAGDEVGIWRFDEGSGTTATDSSGNGNLGSILGDPSYVAGISNTALSLDGNNDYISIPDSSTLDVADAITLDLWINANRTDEYYRLIERDGGTTGDRYWVLRLDKGGTLSFFLWDSGGSSHVVRTSATISVGTWQHITATYDGSRQRIYINDVLRAEGSVDVFTIQTGNQPVHLGGVLANFFFSGLMDEVTIQDTAIPPTPQSLPTTATASPLDVPQNDFQLVMAPNPLRSTTTFRTTADIDQMWVHVFNLEGREVFTTYWTTGELVSWDGVATSGERLANGFYLAYADIRLRSGGMMRTPVLKITILR